MVNRLLKSINEADSVSSLRPIIDWKDDLNRSLTVVNVVTWDRAGLFYKLAGGFSVAGLNILGAKVISRSDHIAIDTFYVVEAGRGRRAEPDRAWKHLRARSKAPSFRTRTSIPTSWLRPRKSPRPVASESSTLHTSFPPTVEVYHELAMSGRSSRSRPATRSACSTGWPRSSTTLASTSRSRGSVPSAVSPSTPSTSRAPTMSQPRTPGASMPCVIPSPA